MVQSGVRELRVRFAGREVVADGSRPLVIGRDRAADLQTSSELVSRRHAVLALDAAQRWVLQDTSKNGMFRDGQRVGSVVIDRVLTVALGDPTTGEPITFEPAAAHSVRPGGPLSQAPLVVASTINQADPRRIKV